MNNKQKIIQAYQQAPWRKQRQIIGIFSAGLVFTALIASVYLNVTARSATLGREIQDMQVMKEEIEKEIEDLETELAELTSARVMEQRARDLGFEYVNPATSLFLPIPGYPGRQTADLAPSPPTLSATTQSLPPEFTMTLLDWAGEMIRQISLQTGAN